jgi:hypothetical protein
VIHEGNHLDCLTFGAGREGNGRALFYPREYAECYVQIENDDEWDEVRSIDFWLLFGEADVHRGVLSRDAQDSEFAGHFTIWLTRQSRLFVRNEHSEDVDTILCSTEPLPASEWTHVGVNIGPGGFEFWLDGVLQAGAGTAEIGFLNAECDVDGSDWSHGLTGNDNPWVIGASQSTTSEGAAVELQHYAYDVAIDELRFGRERQNFADQ